MSSAIFRAVTVLLVGLWLLAHLGVVAAGTVVTIGAFSSEATLAGRALDLGHGLLLLLPHGLLAPRRWRSALIALVAIAVVAHAFTGHPLAPGTTWSFDHLWLAPLLVSLGLCALERRWRADPEPGDGDPAPPGFMGESYLQVPKSGPPR